VTVVERKEVAGFDAAVLSATSAKALTGWLKENGFHYSPEVEAWSEPYVRDGWLLTALRISAREKGVVRADTLRISFKTERPLFPYREPDSRHDADSVNAKSRLLRMYFISDARYQGVLGDTATWSGKPVWSGAIDSENKANLLKALKLPATSGPSSWWLTEFEDRWPYAVAPGDLYFARSPSQQTIERAVIHTTREIDLFFPVFAVVLLVAVFQLLRRKKTPVNGPNGPGVEQPAV
jgi:hypothetical protein